MLFMKILNSKQIKEWDQLTIKHQNISSWDLMERAVLKLTENIVNDIPSKELPIIIFCGKGNNGGDGLGVARELKKLGYKTLIYILKSENYSEDNLKNQQLLSSNDLHFFNLNEELQLPENSVIIDAIFGIGINQPLHDDWNSVFNQIAESNPTQIISIDLPSGFIADSPMQKYFPCCKSNKTYTFQVPKLGLLFPENQIYTDEFILLDIGLEQNVNNEFETNYYFIQKNDVQKFLKKPSQFSHKGTFGHTLIIGGSLGKIGSIILSAKAALKTGSGLVTTYTPQCGLNILQTNLIESMSLTDDSEKQIEHFPEIKIYQGVAVGMGMGQHPTTEANFINWIKNQQQPLVIDADALNCLANQKDCFTLIPQDSVLTPHPKELQRLIGEWENDFEKLEKVKKLAVFHQLTFIIKGFYTAVITSEGKIYFNSTGNWGMATAGSGDTLSGIIASLIGQGYHSSEASILGVYLHGLAGDLAVNKIHPHSLIASNISDFISEAYFYLDSNF